MNEELLNALKLIKAECEKWHKKIGLDCCVYCPLSTNCGYCGVIATEPNLWSLEKREVYF